MQVRVSSKASNPDGEESFVLPKSCLSALSPHLCRPNASSEPEEPVASSQVSEEKLEEKISEMMQKLFDSQELSWLSNLQNLETTVTDLQQETPSQHLENAVKDLQEQLSQSQVAVRDLQKRIVECNTQLLISQGLQERVAKCEDQLSKAAAKHSEHIDAEDMVAEFAKDSREQNIEFEAQNLPSEVEFYELQQSIWDTSFLIGLPDVGFLGSVYMTIFLCINWFMQVTLCVMINDQFTVPEITAAQVTAMREWRISYGHSTDLMNQFTYEPFVASVCHSEHGIKMVTEASQLVNTVSAYLPTGEDYEKAEPFVGPILPHYNEIGLAMSLLAILIWMMYVASSVHDLINRFWATKTIPLGAKTQIVWKSGSCTLTCVTLARRMSCFLVLATEFFVMALLGIAGTWYIIRTLSPRDLLLNCSALAIVLEVDELIFAAMVPHRARHVLNSMEALPRPQYRSLMGVSYIKIFYACWMIACLSYCSVVLHEQAATLKDAYDAICGGNLNFLARKDRAGIISASYVEPVDFSETMQRTYDYSAMRQLVMDESAIHHGFSKEDMSRSSTGVAGHPWSLLEWTSRDLDNVLKFWNKGCQDLIPVSNGAHRGAAHFLHILRDVTQDYSIHDCFQAEQYCNVNNVQGMRTRAICPVTCGCNHPGSKLVLAGASGCPPTCYTTEMYNASMWSRECEDLGLDSPYWSQYREGFTSLVKEDHNMLDNITAHGCGSLSMQVTILGVPWKDRCETHASTVKPFTYACPVSCKCKADFRYLCPNTCRLG